MSRRCCCLLCGNEISYKQLTNHYGSKQCQSGLLFSQRIEISKNRALTCSFCSFVGVNPNSVSQHELHCKNNLNRKNKTPSYGMLGKSGSNQYIYAKKLGLPKPVISQETYLKRKISYSKRPISFSSKESQLVFERLLSQIKNYGRVYCSYLNKEFFLRDEEKIYLYDLTFRDLKLIVEYQGIAYHPKERDDLNFKVIFESMGTVQDIWDKDLAKRKLAESNGFKIMYIWSDDVENGLSSVLEQISKLSKSLETKAKS